jgi:hypothetical protein
MRVWCLPALALAAVFAGLAPAHGLVAKGPVDAIRFEAGEAQRVFEVAEGEALSEFDPWGRQFIDWDAGPAGPPAPESRTYTVSFVLGARVIYVIEYVIDRATGGGLVYIPGSGHPAAPLNAGTIITGSSDRWDPNGKWHHATPAWAAFAASVVSPIRPPVTGDGGLRR